MIMAKKKVKKYSEKQEERDYPAEEQGILPAESSEEIESEMERGEKEEDIYTPEGREKLEEDAEIESWEEGFMEGASGGGQLAKDALTGEPLMGADKIVELEIEGKRYRFTSSENAKKFRKKLSEEREE